MSKNGLVGWQERFDASAATCPAASA